MNLQELLSKASSLKKEGKLADAFKTYSEAFDVLVQEANVYATNFNLGHESIEDGERIWVESPAHFEKAEEYMKRDKTAAVISNNMAVILAELGDAKGAKKWFEQAIELTPDKMDYPDPVINLKNIEDKSPDDRINIDDFSASLRADFISTKKHISDIGDRKEHYCETCKRKIENEVLLATKKEFCSDICYLRYWKEEMPNFGGRWITDENIKEVEQLTGQARQDKYNQIVSFVLDNFDTNYAMLMLRYGDNRMKPKDKEDRN